MKYIGKFCHCLIIAAVANCFALPDTVWTKAIQFEGYNAYGMDCKETSDGNIIMTGYLNSTDSLDSVQHGFLLKMNGCGELLWKRIYEDTALIWGTSIIKSDNNSYLISGICGHSEGNDFKRFDGVIIETDAEGSIKSRIVFDNGGWDAADYGILAIDSGIAIAGLTENGNSMNINAWIIKTDSKGLVKWSKVVGDTNSAVCFHISQTHDNGYIATGYSGSSTLLIKLDSAGDVQWKKTYIGLSDDSETCGYAVMQTSNGDYIIAGYGYKANRDVLLFCTDSLGNLKWQKLYGEEGDDEATSFLLMPDGGVLIAGKNSKGSDNSSDIWILHTNAGGDTLWTRKYGGSWFDNAESITVSNNGSFLIAGTTKLTESGENYAWVLRFALDVTMTQPVFNSKVSIHSKQTTKNVVLGTNTPIFFHHGSDFKNGVSRFYDIQGRSIADFSRKNFSGVLLMRTIMKKQYSR